MLGRLTPVVCLALVSWVIGCSGGRSHSVIGTWVVRHSAAPFPYHMYVFNSDGTMQQANPDAGNAGTSDSDGKGVWVEGDSVRGKFVEIRADRTSHAFIGRGEITFAFVIRGDSLAGSVLARFYDSTGVLVEGPYSSDMLGSRVTLP